MPWRLCYIPHFICICRSAQKLGTRNFCWILLLYETDKNCAILFLTGFDKFDYARQAISVRAMDYLLKPAVLRRLPGMAVAGES